MHSRNVTLTLPLDHDNPGGGTIDVFARIVAADGGGDRPYLVFLQGGPGQESPRPSFAGDQPGWLGRALQEYQVVLLDQRGTGNSTPIGSPDDVPGRRAADKARWLSHLRADAIVRDCEALREHLGAERISLLGQSFGGFTSVAYLSMFPDRLAEVYITGGLTPVGHDVDEIYARTYALMQRKSAEHYARHPGDRERVRAVLDACAAGRVVLPDGTVTTPELFRTLGYKLGMSGGDLELHHLLERDPASPAFAHDLAAMLPFNARNPLYAVIHESSYADGMATRWSAQRVRPAAFDDDPTLLTGEHVFPWHFQVCNGLAPWREVAEAVAEYRWDRLYDAEVLARTTASVGAIAYTDDVFVDYELSRETAAMIPGIHLWVTNEWEHNGLRVAGDRVVGRLIDLVKGRTR